MRCYSIGWPRNKYTKELATTYSRTSLRIGPEKVYLWENIWYRRQVITKSCLECSYRCCNMCRSIHLATRRSFCRRFRRIGTTGPKSRNMLRTRWKSSHSSSPNALGPSKIKLTYMLDASSTMSATRRVSSSASLISPCTWKKVLSIWLVSCSNSSYQQVKKAFTSGWRTVYKNCSILSSPSRLENCKRIQMRHSTLPNFWKDSLTLWTSVGVQSCSDSSIDSCGSIVPPSWQADLQQL